METNGALQNHNGAPNGTLPLTIDPPYCAIPSAARIPKAGEVWKSRHKGPTFGRPVAVSYVDPPTHSKPKGHYAALEDRKKGSTQIRHWHQEFEYVGADGSAEAVAALTAWLASKPPIPDRPIGLVPASGPGLAITAPCHSRSGTVARMADGSLALITVDHRVEPLGDLLGHRVTITVEG